MRAAVIARGARTSPTASPIDRVNAQPGVICSASQIRGGSPSPSSPPALSSSPNWSSPIGTNPSSWSILATRAPARLQRSRSSLRKGVWSRESEYATRWSSRCCAMIARESPTLATWIVPPSNSTTIAVVPLSESSIDDLWSPSFTWMNASLYAFSKSCGCSLHFVFSSPGSWSRT